MKKIIAGIFALMIALSIGKTALAAPNNANKAENNPNQVAYYENGLHAIPTDPITYVNGTNLVTQQGNGEIQAWYTGSDGHGYHSNWNVAKKDSCPNGWTYIPDAYPTWGDYLTPDTDYCVKVNSF